MTATDAARAGADDVLRSDGWRALKNTDLPSDHGIRARLRERTPHDLEVFG